MGGMYGCRIGRRHIHRCVTLTNQPRRCQQRRFLSQMHVHVCCMVQSGDLWMCTAQQPRCHTGICVWELCSTVVQDQGHEKLAVW